MYERGARKVVREYLAVDADGAVATVTGTVVADHCTQTPSGTAIEVADGEVTEHTLPDDREASELARAFAADAANRRLAELGIGTNPQATLVGNILQDEKALGTCHVAFGDNTSYVAPDDPVHNPAPIHYDLILERPTVRVDGRLPLDRGAPEFPH